MDLILKCISNRHQVRGHASETAGQLAEMVLRFPFSFANRLEMLRRIEAIMKENKDLRKNMSDLQEENRDLREQESTLREEIEKINSEMWEPSMLKIENKATDHGLSLQDLSSSQVS